MARLSIQPTDVTFSGKTQPRIECELRLAASFVGQGATLVVYDADVYYATPAAQAERAHASPGDQGLALPGFTVDGYALTMEQPPGNSGTFVDPDVNPGTGVLFSLHGRIAQAKNGRIFLDIAGASPKEVPNPKVSIDLFMRDKTGQHVARVGAIGFFADDLPFARDCRLLFRLAHDESVGGGEVFAASMGAQGGATNPVVVVHVPAAALDADDTIGGAEAVRSFGLPESLQRVTVPDLTGFYSSIDPPETVRPLCVTVNQAGQAIAGWVTDVPPWFPPVGGATLTTPPFIVDKDGTPHPMPPLLLFTGISAGANQWDLTWWDPATAQNAGGPDPDRTPAFRNDDINLCAMGPGRLSLAPDASATDDALLLSLSLDSLRGSYGPFLIVRTCKESRLPTALIDNLAALSKGPTAARVRQAQDYLRARHVRPLHMAYWSHVDEIISSKNAKLVQALNKYLDNNGLGPEAQSAEADIRLQLARVLERVDPIYDGELRDYVRATAAKDVPLGNDGRGSMLDRLEKLMNTEWAHYRTNPDNKDVPDADLYRNNIDSSLQRLGIAPVGTYQYVLTFQQLNAKMRAGIGIGAIVYSATLTRQVALVTGAFQDDPTFGSVEYEGAAIDFSVGASPGWSLGTGGAFASKVTFPSSINLSASDFHHAWVTQSGVVLLKGSLGSFVSASLFDIESISILLQNGVSLSATKESDLRDGPKANVKISKDWGSPTFKKLFLKWSKPNVLVAHTVWTMLVFPSEVQAPAPRPEDGGGTLPFARDVSRTTDIHFDYYSAKIIDRDELELRLAVDRALFVSGATMAYAVGFTSPEGSPSLNQNLSAARALSVEQAVKDAFGSALQVHDLIAYGLGERPAEDAGLLNPPGSTEEDKRTIQIQSHRDWPAWRKVELRADGVLVVRLMGRGAGGPQGP